MSVIPGTGVGESLAGGLADDTITGAGGNDSISGSEGVDTAVYAGTSAGYQLGYTSGKFVVTDIDLGDGNDGTDQLSGIETLDFGNVDFRLAPVGEFRVNTTTTNAQNGAAITKLSGGGFVVSWVSNAQDGSGTGIYAQLYDANGNTSGSEFRLNATTSGDQDSVAVAALADGGFVATWQSADAAFEGIWYRRFDASGTAASVNDIAVNTTTASSQFSPTVIALSNGNYVISWTSNNQDSSGFGIYARVYDSSGATVVGETRVNTATADDQLDSSIAALSGGGYVVTWTSFSQEAGVGSQTGIYAQLYNANGTTSGGEFHVNTYTTNYQTNPSVCALSGGGFVVTWQSLGQDGNADGIYAQVFNASGATVGSEFIVNTTTAGAQQSPAITALTGGGFAIAWQSAAQDGSGYGIIARVFEGGGSAVGGEIAVNTSTSGDQKFASITGSADGGFIISWQSNGQDGDLEGIYARHFDASGNDVKPTVLGTSGADTINIGGDGDLTAVGLGGDDTYIVNSAGDVITETAAAGTDTVQASLSWTLADNLENLVLTGSANINGTGNGADNQLAGNAGRNTLDGQGGADTLAGGAGNDTYVVDNAGDIITELAGEGTDTVSASVSYSLVDTDGAGSNGGNVENLTLTGSGNLNGTGSGVGNILSGNSGDNSLDGGDGNDTLNGGAGNDQLTGGNGTDTASYTSASGAVTVNLTTVGAQNTVGAGSDTLVSIENLAGSALGDTLTGDANANTIDGQGGADTLAGGAGNDVYVVDNAGDIVTELTGEGSDSVLASINYSLADTDGAGSNGGNVENITLTGSGNINATGNGVNNAIVGNTGNNILTGGDGNDIFSGGAGDDQLNGGNGTDTASYSSATGPVTVNLGTVGAQNTVGAGSDTLVSIENITGSSSGDTLTGDGNANTLDGQGGADTLAGGAGNDVYVVENAGDSVTELAGQGTDTVVASISYSLVDTDGAGSNGGNVENLTLSGSGNINGTGNGLANAIVGNSGNNSLDGADGNDILSGGAGNDVLNGGNGTDTASYTSASGAVTVNLTLAGAQNTLGAGTDTLISIENLTGSALADTLTGDANANNIDGQGGADTLAGGAGNDVYVVDNVGDVVTELGGQGTDTIIAAFSYSLVDTDGAGSNGGNVENLTLSGVGNFNATGTSVGNVLAGNGGDNSLDGADGNDTLNGGAGNDQLNGGIGTDTATYTSASGAVTVNLTLAGAQNTLGAGTDTLISIENLTGSALGDTLTGDANANTIDGQGGADTLAGGAGNDVYVVDNAGDIITELAAEGTDTVIATISYSLVDTDGVGSNGGNVENLTLSGAGNINATGNAVANVLAGNGGNNSLDGGDGNDTLIGGAGNDQLNGGNSTDTASYTSASGAVTVNLTIIGAQNTIGAGTDTLVSIENLSGSALGDTLTGDGNANTLDGQGGADTLDGGAGNDVYVVDNAGDIVTELAGQGTDTVLASISYSLVDTDGAGANGDNVEKLTLSGSSSINATGNALGNTLTGNSGNNIIAGGDGSDTLTGGAGADHFVFDTTPNVLSNLDRVSDFVTTVDKIVLDDDVFGGTGTINAGVSTSLAGNQFESGAGVTTAHAAETRIIYDTSTGNLYYDADGTGGTAAIQFATLTNHPTLASGDFLIVA